MAEFYYELGWNNGTVPGFDALSEDFCNRPVRVVSDLSDEPKSVDMFAAILLCGRLADHAGPCDHLPPVEDVM